jgi:phosphate transport system substrate-binding protein
MRRNLFDKSTILLAVTLLVGCSGGGGGGGTPPGGPVGAGQPSKLGGTVEIDGSSTVYRLSAGAHELFQEEHPDVEVVVNFSGTGAGFTKFLEGRIDILDASRPIQQNEIDKARGSGIEYIELPVAFDALTVAVHVDNDWVNEITIADLKKLWEPAAKGQVTHWSHLNPAWPDKKITLFGAGHDSGTFDYFTEAVMEKKGSTRSDATATEDDNVIVQGVAGDKFALGYLPYAYYEPNKDKLKALKIDWKADDDVQAVEPSPETVRAGQYNPLSRPLFIYVNKKSAERPEVEAFVEFYLAQASSLATRLKYVPLPAAAYDMARERFAQRRTGTGFGGKSEFGLPIEDILKRQPQS